MRVRLPHSNGLFLSRWGTPLTDLRASVPDGKRFCPGKFVPVSKIEGNLPRLGAKSIHVVGYLPGLSQEVCLDRLQSFPLGKHSISRTNHYSKLSSVLTGTSGQS